MVSALAFGLLLVSGVRETRRCGRAICRLPHRSIVLSSANALLGDLQARGIITLAERRDLASEWVRDYVRGCLPAFYRDKNAEAIGRLGLFLKTS